jgi:hypothetical protein
VLEDRDLLLLADLVEIVHIELTHEGGKLLVLEVLRQDLILELLLTLHDETVAVVRPLNYVRVPPVLQNAVGLYDEVRNVLLTVQTLLGRQRLLLVQVGLDRSLYLVLLQLDAVLRVVIVVRHRSIISIGL